MTLSDLKQTFTFKYLSTAVKKVRIAMSVVGRHFNLKAMYNEFDFK